jgi:hypothetical protein
MPLRAGDGIFFEVPVAGPERSTVRPIPRITGPFRGTSIPKSSPPGCTPAFHL